MKTKSKKLKSDLSIGEFEDIFQEIPEQLPVVVISEIMPIPNVDFRIEVSDNSYLKALKESETNANSFVILLTQKGLSHNKPKLTNLQRYGVLAQIITKVKIPHGDFKVRFRILQRVKIDKFLQKEPFLKVSYEKVKTVYGSIEEEKALIKLVIEKIMDKPFQLLVQNTNNFLDIIKTEPETENITDIIIFNLKIDDLDKYKYLKESHLNKRIFYILQDIQSLLIGLDLEQKINEKVKQSIDENQKEFYLREKMKAIQLELGDKAKKEEEIAELRDKIKKTPLPPEIKKKALQELSRYQTSSLMAESFVIKNYLDFLLELPWGKTSQDENDLVAIEKSLNNQHYGLQKVKERILEYAAVKIMTKKNPQNILCLVGPPGVGKTSLASSIAKALGRQFVRQSLGGLKEESEIRGHRRTYIGAMPGRILAGIRDAKTVNPVFLLDEIDKLVTNYNFDPASALLEVLDPQQNINFMDHFLSEPFDLSQVLFIATANYLDNVPEALKDRMEIIEVSSYTEKDKINIASKYLLKKQLKNHGITDTNLVIDNDTILYLIRHYTKEAGVRELDRILAELARKTVKECLIKKKEQVIITTKNVTKYLGKEKYLNLLDEQKEKIGSTNGLAYTYFGGDLLPVEVTYYKGKGQLVLTGKLGEVLKESAYTALSFIKANCQNLGIDANIFAENDFHIHLPEAAIPKDGPSAGITIATSLVSAITQKYIKKGLGMTGEITLRGNILAIGGLKEKAIAANRSGLDTIFIPQENLKDIEDIPEEVRNKLNIIPVSNISDVFSQVFVV
ncbi:ATP-dependent protease La [Aster yellows witches'-broom phytoplasma AYWB]|uniref:Lon protease n=1 Tax=Aster yellows witches'-broom phytoplasma (strain AYWB) TaxID=322098 RepID=LON_AYWBP|nr:endopeptidase La [Aster yellows witches'-broom phytoplasma]Q2NJE3.1 RecName: Full=Lon protease; AltName: Full=ATP-dependent protease La [Aster yellows witches'-broom phytoplasma AYWB]ABC65450.1 ATP-dependent protease La [Aster yellows witches'-broom phytoplasma AYWB]